MPQRSDASPHHPWLSSIEGLEWATPPHGPQDVGWADYLGTGVLNLTDTLLGRHVRAGRGDDVALVAPSALAASPTGWSYRRLLDLTARFATGLDMLGVGRGSRVLIFGDATLESYVSVLGCLHAGVAWSFVRNDLDPLALAQRLGEFTPDAVVVAQDPDGTPARSARNVLHRAYDVATHRPPAMISAGLRDAPAAAAEASWWDMVDTAAPGPSTPLPGSHPAWVSYSAGTERDPRGYVRRLATYAAGLHCTTVECLKIPRAAVVTTDSRPGTAAGDTAFLGALLAGATFVPFRTGSVDSTVDLAGRHAVAVLGERGSLSFLAAGVPWSSQMETVHLWGESARSSAARTTAVKGSIDVVPLYWRAEDGHPLRLQGDTFDPERIVGLSCRPLWPDAPFGELVTSGFPPVERMTGTGADGTISVVASVTGATGDLVRMDPVRGVSLVGRLADLGTDLATVRTVVMLEDLLRECAGVVDVAVVHAPAASPALQAFVVLDAAGDARVSLLAEIRRLVSTSATGVEVVSIPRLPRTRTGSVLRRTLRDLLVGRDIPVPSSLAQVGALDEVRAAITGRAAGIDILTPDLPSGPLPEADGRLT